MFLSWSKSDRDKAIVQFVRSRTACGKCGTRQEEWDPEKGGSRDAYHTELGHCPGCAAVQAAQTKLQAQSDGSVVPGTFVRLKRG